MAMHTTKTLTEKVFGANGFEIFVISESDLKIIRALIFGQFIERVTSLHPTLTDEFNNIQLDMYHTQSHLIDHKKSWPKKARILPKKSVSEIRKLSFFNVLESEFGIFQISDEEGLGYENIYWRLVRPGSQSDVGPLHADEWFWALGHGTTPPNVKRIKVWIAIYCEKGKGGFRFLRGSHLREWPYRGVMKDGIMKPEVNFSPEELDLELFQSDSGQGIIFNDKLLHGGFVGGTRTRVSLEFTMFVRK